MLPMSLRTFRRVRPALARSLATSSIGRVGEVVMTQVFCRAGSRRAPRGLLPVAFVLFFVTCFTLFFVTCFARADFPVAVAFLRTA
jgi:hypothetical protein